MVACLFLTVSAADKAQPGAYITLKNAKVDMYRGSMRLEVDASGAVEEAEGDFQPKVCMGMLASPCAQAQLSDAAMFLSWTESQHSLTRSMSHHALLFVAHFMHITQAAKHC